MENLKKISIIGIIVSVILIILTLVITFKTTTDGIRFKNEYESLNNINKVNITIDKNNKIKYATIEEVIDILQNKTGVIYFGFPNCPWCRNILPVLLETVDDTIYYYNPKQIRDNNSSEYQILKDILNDYLTEDEEGNKKLYVPDVYFVKEGKIVGNHLGSVDSQKDPYQPLTEEQRQEIKEEYQKLFNLLK